MKKLIVVLLALAALIVPATASAHPLGNFTINSAGDTSLTPITIYKQSGKSLIPVKTLIPQASLIG